MRNNFILSYFINFVAFLKFYYTRSYSISGAIRNKVYICMYVCMYVCTIHCTYCGVTCRVNLPKILALNRSIFLTQFALILINSVKQVPTQSRKSQKNQFHQTAILRNEVRNEKKLDPTLKLVTRPSNPICRLIVHEKRENECY